MLSKAFRLCVVCLFLVPVALLAQIPPVAEPASSGCNMQLIDLTDPGLAQMLAGLTLAPSGPMSKEYKTDGVSTTSKVTRGDFAAVDADGSAISVTVECTLTCTGRACNQSGCEPSGNGCSFWNCGDGCTGSCVQRTVQTTGTGTVIGTSGGN